jgi:hypothetical protein
MDMEAAAMDDKPTIKELREKLRYVRLITRGGASISTSHVGSMKPETWTNVHAGRISRMTSPWARAASRKREMLSA